MSPLSTICRYALLSVPVLLLMVMGAAELRAQGVESSNPLGARTIYPRIGLEGGFDRTEQDGEYAVGCGVFEEGSGLNVLFGASYEYAISDYFRVEGLLGFRTRNVSYNYRTNEQSVVRTGENEFLETMVDYDNVGSLKTSWIFLQPSLTWFPTTNIYLGVGLNVGLNVGATAGYQRNIETKVVTLDNDRVVEIFFPAADSDDPHSRIFPSVDPDVSTILVDPVAMAGLELRLGREFFIGPRVSYAIPLMPTLSNPDLFLSSITATLAIRKHLR